jgi:hypothetical protein
MKWRRGIYQKNDVGSLTEHVHMGFACRSDHAVSEIVAGVAVRKKIVWLVLSYNAVGQQSCSALANLLMTSRTLERLECHWGHMRGQGAVEFADALKYARGLKHLDVGWNGFGDIRALYPKFPGSSPCRCIIMNPNNHCPASLHVDVRGWD